MKSRIVLGLFLFFYMPIYSVILPQPAVKNYTKNNYEAACQNWAAGCDEKGVLYFGNEYGMLEFNGNHWQLHKVTGESSIRAIYVESHERIYVGTYEEFGYFQRNAYGNLEYHSLANQVLRDQPTKCQIWSIAHQKKKIYFQSFGTYFVYDGQETRGVKTPHRMTRFSNIGEEIYTTDNQQLLHFNGGQVTFLGEKSLQNTYPQQILSRRNDSSKLIVTEKKGILSFGNDGQFKTWNAAINNELGEAHSSCAMITSDSLLIVGTLLNGIYAFSLDGKLTWHLNSENGLQSNSVLGVTCDNENNIWVALDNGISTLFNSNGIKAYTWKMKNIGFVYDIKSFNNTFHIATNQGLFNFDPKQDQPTFIKGSEGFILSLYPTGTGEFIVGHGKSSFLVNKNGELEYLHGGNGGMCYQEIKVRHERLILQSDYTSINVYHQDAQGKWSLRNRLEDLKTPLQTFEIDDNGTLWAGDLHQGIYRIETDVDFRKVKDIKYYPSTNGQTKAKSRVFKLQNRVVFVDGKEFYTYDDLNDRLIPYTLMNKKLGQFAKAHIIKRVNMQLYWFIAKQEAALIEFEKGNPHILRVINYAKYGFNMIDEYENIVPLSDSLSVFSCPHGIAYIEHYVQPIKNPKMNVPYLAQAAVRDGEKEYPLKVRVDSDFEIPFLYNTLRCRIAVPVYSEKEVAEYRMKGLEHSWQRIDGKQELEFTRLPVGKYELQIRITDEYGIYKVENRYNFEILPPFYNSIWGYMLYLLLAVIAFFVIYKVSTHRAMLLAKELQEEQERQHVFEKNKELTGEVSSKSKELAKNAMDMIRKNETMEALKGEIDALKEHLGSHFPMKSYNQLIEIINRNLSTRQEWEVFQSNFDLIHENFFRNLRDGYPELTAQDLKMCALLRLNLDTKEIAALMNLSVRGVESHRYRLRRRLCLDSKTNLAEFLMDFKIKAIE